MRIASLVHHLGFRVHLRFVIVVVVVQLMFNSLKCNMGKPLGPYAIQIPRTPGSSSLLFLNIEYIAYIYDI